MASRPTSRQVKTPSKRQVKDEGEEKKPKKLPKSYLNIKLEDEDLRIVPLMMMPESYYDLQTEIAKYLPRMRQVLIVRDEEKQILTNKNFHPSNVYLVREVNTTRMPEYIPVEKLKWDFTEYHAKLPGWVDAFELKKLEEEEKKAEEEDKLMDDDDIFGVSS